MSLATGTALGQAILFATSLVSVRLFTPEEMGVFATQTAIAACLLSFATGRYDFAIPIPKSHRTGLDLARLSIAISLGFSLLLALGLYIFRGTSHSGWIGAMLQSFWAPPAMTLSLALFTVANQLAVRTENYKAIARRSVLYPTVTGVIQIAAGLGGAGAPGLILSVIVGQLVAFLTLWIPTRRELKLAHAEVRPKRLRTLAWEQRKFPLLLSSAGALNALSTQLPLLVVASIYGLHVSGQFGVAVKILVLPVALIGQSVGYVFTGESARRLRASEASVAGLYVAASKRLGLMGVGLFIAVVVTAPIAFPLVLGHQWQLAGTFAQLLALGVAAQLVAAPLSQTMTIARRQASQFTIDVARVALIGIAGLISGALHWSSIASVITMSLAVALGYGVLWWANRRAAVALDERSRANAMHSAVAET